ncbi:hypothetical protein PMI16_04222 [Herbaspirillum sp. CF444]|nr:hypothetical protein PMI16_04222 [Herbaspirillum sp. CF444]
MYCFSVTYLAENLMDVLRLAEKEEVLISPYYGEPFVIVRKSEWCRLKNNIGTTTDGQAQKNLRGLRSLRRILRIMKSM